MRSYILTDREEQAVLEYVGARLKARLCGSAVPRRPNMVQVVMQRARAYLPRNHRQMLLLYRLLDLDVSKPLTENPMEAKG